jgi:hypothetical protein
MEAFIGLGLLVLSLLFGHMGKPWWYIFGSILLGVSINFILNPQNLATSFVFISFLGSLGSLAIVIGFASSLLIHFVAWWIGTKI